MVQERVRDDGEVYDLVAKTTTGIDRLPDKLLDRMRKVFSKHSVKEVREWGD